MAPISVNQVDSGLQRLTGLEMLWPAMAWEATWPAEPLARASRQMIARAAILGPDRPALGAGGREREYLDGLHLAFWEAAVGGAGEMTSGAERRWVLVKHPLGW